MIGTLALAIAPGTSPRAQDAPLETRLRDALRSTSAQLHGLQDQLQAAQAQLVQTRTEADGLRQQVVVLEQQLEAAKQAAPAPAPMLPQTPGPSDAETPRLRRALAAAEARNGELEARIGAATAVAKSADSQARAETAARQASLAGARTLVQTCHDANEKLAVLAGEILDTYESQSFRAVWLKSYEPLLGLDRVKLQNIVQAFEDRVYDLRLPAIARDGAPMP